MLTKLFAMSIKEKAKIFGVVDYGTVTYVSKVDTQ
jgi:hypothetical protein